VSRYEDELQRIRSAYERRDAATGRPGAAGWSDPGYRFYMQRLEWGILAALDASGFDLAGARVLDVGCGSGYFAHRFTEYGAASASGIDLMEQRVQHGRGRYPTLELVAGDAGALPWEDEAFDLVAQFTCLSSILDPAVRALVAAEMWRVLRKGGAVLSYDIERPHTLVRALRRARGIEPHVTTPTTPIERDELERLFGRAAFAAHLSLGLTPLARRHRALAATAAAIPLLRSHLLYAARKPRLPAASSS
jgi:SAM-dependent methyltransferase